MPGRPLPRTRGYRDLCDYVLARDRNLCQIQGPTCTRVATEVDHIVARADGGDVWAASNLRASCRACNARRGAERTNAARYRTGLARYETRL
jgi:5-methylcytosine-specific restriction protein A